MSIIFLKFLVCNYIVWIVEIEFCARYSMDNYKGLKVLTTKNFPPQTPLNFATGYIASLTRKRKLHITKTRNDFSLMKNTPSKHTSLFLGPYALFNHSCCNNCTYTKPCKGSTGIKTTKFVHVNEELFCFYDYHYFGETNI